MRFSAPQPVGIEVRKVACDRHVSYTHEVLCVYDGTQLPQRWLEVVLQALMQEKVAGSKLWLSEAFVCLC